MTAQPLTGRDYERDKREQTEAQRIIENIQRLQLALPIIGPSVEVKP